MAGEDLAIDRDVRDWVFIPLTVFILLMKLLTQYMHQLLSPQAAPATKELPEVREQQVVQRSQRLRALFGWIPEPGFRMRKDFLVGRDGVLNAKPVTRPMHETMATDPSFMVDMMKKNLSGIVPQLVMGAYVSFFFSGFVMGKIPFALSPRFKPMLQRGVDLQSLDSSYFTSLSYYIILLFSLRGAFSLVFREDTVDEAEMMRRQANPMAAGPAQFDATAAFKSEKAALEALDHEWALADAEELAARTLRALVAAPKGKRAAPALAKKQD